MQVHGKTGAYGPSTGRGFTLIEALVSLVVLAVGLIVLANFQGSLTRGSAETKARNEAIALAQQQIAHFRSTEYAELAAGSEVVDGRLATYSIDWDFQAVGTMADERMMLATIEVRWLNPSGVEEDVTLLSYLARAGFAGGADFDTGAGGFEPPTVVPPTGGAERLQLSPDQIAGLKEKHGFEEEPMPGVIRVTDSPEGNIYIIDTETGQAILVYSPHLPSIISGSLYVRNNAGGSALDVYVESTALALCTRSPPQAEGANYMVSDYSCYMASSNTGAVYTTFGWYGDIGILHPTATNQDGVCVGAASPDPATAMPSSLRRYRGYEHRYGAGGHPMTGEDGLPILFPIGLADGQSIDGHHFLVARIGNNPSPGDCIAEMTREPFTTLGATHPFHANPADFYCFTELCPGIQMVEGPAGCPSIGDVCDASGEPYDGLVYAGYYRDGFLFTTTNDAGEATWDTAVSQCTGKGTGWFLGNVNQVSQLLFDHREAIGGFGTGNYWTRDEAAGQSRWFVEFVDGNPGTQRGDIPSPYRCLYQVP